MNKAELAALSTETLERMCERKSNELYDLRMELSRRRGDTPAATTVNFEQYVTD